MLGAGAAAIVVVLGVLAGPSVVTCFNSPDGLGQCLRGKMAEVGLVPAPVPLVATQEAQAEPAADVAEAEAEVAVSEAPALDVAPPVEPEVEAQKVIAATFGLLRAEPDGSVVIAGSGAPGSMVDVFANGQLLGSTRVEPSGDWVLVPDEPLQPGGLEITLGEQGAAGEAQDAFIVVINEDKTSQPLVVASTPGQASEILQGLVGPAARQQPAAPPPVTAAVPAEPAAAPAEVATAPVDVATTPAEPAAAPAEVAAPAAAVADVPAAVVEAVPPALEVAALPQPVEVAPVAATAPSEAPAVSPEETVTEVAAAETPVATPVPAPLPVETPAPVIRLAAVPPTIDAIEVEGQRSFFAGGGPDKGVIRLYVDGAHIADTVVAEGRWLVEAGPVLTNPSQRVRIDLLQPETAQVLARAEVDFVVELPGAPAPVTVAEETPAAAPEAPAAPAPEVAVAPAAEPVAVAPAVAPPSPAVAAEPAAVVPTMVAVSLGDPEAQRFASGRAIIRRGDNLWTIARRVYGEGLKYTTIYEANVGQIRDPNRIYPGQVFNLPEGLERQ